MKRKKKNNSLRGLLMNSRERVYTTLNHKEPDKVPQYCDFVQQIALPCEELLKRFKI